MGKLLNIAIRDATRAPMQEYKEATVTFKDGIIGDFRGRVKNRQVTIITRESWEDACAELSTDLPWTTRRANLLIENIDLQDTKGHRLTIGDLQLQITGELAPCHRMEESCSGLESALKPLWRGGVTCKVLKEGDIKVGDEVILR